MAEDLLDEALTDEEILAGGKKKKRPIHLIPEDFVPDLVKRPLSYSSLKHFAISPLHFLHYLTKPRETTVAMFLGNVVDCLLLEPDEFDNRYITIPADAPSRPQDRSINAKYMQKGTKDFKQDKYDAVMRDLNWWLEFEKSCEGKEFIPKEILERAEIMVKAVKAYEPAAKLLEQITQTQKKFLFKDKETGLDLIVRMDGYGKHEDETLFVMDLKTSRDPEEDSYNRQAFDLSYHLQAGISLRAIQNDFHSPTFKTRFYQIIVENVEPFSVDVREADQDFKNVGLGELDRLLREVCYCRDNNLWRQAFDFKRFNNKIGTLSLPGYARKLIELHK